MSPLPNLKSIANRAVSQLGFQNYASEGVMMEDVYKAVIPYYLYRPPFGRPRNIDVDALRKLGRSPYANIINKAVIDYITSLDWEIIPTEGNTLTETQTQELENLLRDPNENPSENFKWLLRVILKDILELDSGVLTKVFTKSSYEDLQTHQVTERFVGNQMHPGCGHTYEIYMNGKLKPPNKRELSQIYARDGATFTKNPNMYGVMPDECAYFQYYGSTSGKITAFNRDEIVYMEMQPRSYDVYGWSYIQAADSMLDALLGGINMYQGYFRNNEIPPGFLQAIGAQEQDIRALQQRIRQRQNVKDDLGQWQRLFHRMLIVNNEVKWTPVTLDPREMEFIAQQQWFFRLLIWNAGMNESWLGWTESVNKATDLTQQLAFKQKVGKPYADMIEYYITSQILSESGWPAQLKFIHVDTEGDIKRDDRDTRRLDKGMITINEWRVQNDLDEVEWGNEPFKGGGGLDDGVDEKIKAEISKFEKSMQQQILKAGNSGAGFEKISAEDDDGFTDESDDKGCQGKPKKKEEKAFGSEAGGPAPDNKPALAIGRGETIDEEEGALSNVLTELLTKEADRIEEMVVESLSNNVLQEIKASIADIPDLIEDFLKGLSAMMALPVMQSIENAFKMGNAKAEVQLNMQFVPNGNAIKFIQNYTFQNIKDMTEEVGNDLRQVFQRGIMNGDGPETIRKEIEKVMNVGRNRAKMIARTELNRAFNAGSYSGYEQSGLKGEIEWIVKKPRPEDPHPQCNAFAGKRVPIGEKFKYKGEEYLYPPVGPNCHSTIAFHPSPDKMVEDEGAEVKAVAYWLKHDPEMSVAQMGRILCRSRPTVYRIIEIVKSQSQR